MFPSADGVLDTMIPNYLTGVIYGCLVEAYASENNARMTAMQSSTDSAKKMLTGSFDSVQPCTSGSDHAGDHRGLQWCESPEKEGTIMSKGKIVQVMGPVVDVVFEEWRSAGYQGCS